MEDQVITEEEHQELLAEIEQLKQERDEAQRQKERAIEKKETIENGIRATIKESMEPLRREYNKQLDAYNSEVERLRQANQELRNTLQHEQGEMQSSISSLEDEISDLELRVRKTRSEMLDRPTARTIKNAALGDIEVMLDESEEVVTNQVSHSRSPWTKLMDWFRGIRA